MVFTLYLPKKARSFNLLVRAKDKSVSFLLMALIQGVKVEIWSASGERK
jgi:hypothetical protein